MAKSKVREVFLTPIFTNNPIALQVLGICSALAVTVQMMPSVVMCISVLFVLVIDTRSNADGSVKFESVFTSTEYNVSLYADKAAISLYEISISSSIYDNEKIVLDGSC